MRLPGRKQGQGVYGVSFWIGQVVSGMGMLSAWRTLPTQGTWGILLVYGALAGWSDLRTRTIPNALTFGALGILLCVRLFTGAGLVAALGALWIGFLFFWPTLAGLWAQGDWKMSMVYGAALGVLPVVALWVGALCLAKIGGRWTTAWSRIFLDERRAASIPLGLFMLFSTILAYCSVSIWSMR